MEGSPRFLAVSSFFLLVVFCIPLYPSFTKMGLEMLNMYAAHLFTSLLSISYGSRNIGMKVTIHFRLLQFTIHYFLLLFMQVH